MRIVLHISFLVLVSAIAVAGKAQSGQGADQGKLVFNELVHDFGKIPQGRPVYTDFKVKNTASQPLAIDAVNASCGCTTPVWSNEPIPSGGSSVIKVGYNAAAPGYFEKTISVNYGSGSNVMLTIKGEVWKTPEQPAPSNPSISFLKTLKPVQKN